MTMATIITVTAMMNKGYFFYECRYSRRVNLCCGQSNNDPHIIAQFYINTVRVVQGGDYKINCAMQFTPIVYNYKWWQGHQLLYGQTGEQKTQ